MKNLKKIQEAVKYKMPNVLLISGDNRNVGKTTLGCRIINELSGKAKSIAIKVSPHFHPLSGSLEIIMEYPDIVIARETDESSRKDSSRYQMAGASEVYYVQYKKEGLQILVEWILENIQSDIPVICEAGGLSDLIIPGYSVYIRQGYGENFFASSKEIIYSNFQPDNIKSNIFWRNKRWQLQ